VLGISAFFDINNRDISTDYTNLPSVAVTVCVTFEFQKKEVRNNSVSHQRSSDKVGMGEMCPVKAAIATIRCIVEYDLPPEKFRDTPINYVQFEGQEFTAPPSMVLQHIRQAVSALRHKKLGFMADEVGTHSNRSGGAMGMFLTGTPV